MATLTVTKTISYTDPDSGATYNVTATKTAEASHARRDRLEIEAIGSATEIVGNDVKPYNTGRFVYCCIENIGNSSAYIAFYDGTNNPPCFEVPAGTIHDFWGEDIWGADTGSTQRALVSIYANGSTSLEIDVFT